MRRHRPEVQGPVGQVGQDQVPCGLRVQVGWHMPVPGGVMRVRWQGMLASVAVDRAGGDGGLIVVDGVGA